MRHRKKINHLGRKAEHREAMLANMASSLILHKRIKTTVAKAKALREFVEPLITRAKKDRNETKEQYTHNIRVVYKHIKNKDAVKELFNNVAERIGDRPGGYTRILKLGYRLGDGAQMCYIELVDFNTTYRIEKDKTQKKHRTRRGRKKKSSEEQQTTNVENITEQTQIDTQENSVQDVADEEKEQKENKSENSENNEEQNKE